MNTLQNAPVNEQTFTQFLFHNRRSRIILYFAAVAIVIQFAVFKYLYPFANYIHDDSLFYLNAAGENLTINTYPIGYSKFLRLVSVFAKPDLVLVGLQYLLIQCSSLFLLFTIFYFYKAGPVTQTILFCLTVINPLFLHLGNMISSDGLFLALSTTWFALLLWILYKPSNTIIGWHAIVLFAAFTVRYNALIYPFIAVLSFGLSNLPLRKKLAGLGFCLLICSWFVGLTLFQYKKLTGYWQFSPFSGWQLASNAIIGYQEVDSANRKPVPAEFRALDNMVCNFNKMHPEMTSHWDATGYMWRPDFPLMQYCDSQFKKDTSFTRFKKWARMGPFYSSYGWYLIKTYPAHFLRYYVLPNSLKYLAPPVEFLGSYNLGQPTVNKLVVKWFGYTNNQVKTRTKSDSVSILQPYPFLVSLINLILFLMLLSYILLQGWQYSPSFNKSIILAGFLWITNTGFTIVASPVALRFQAFPVMLNITFSLLLMEWMVRLIQHMKRQQQPDSLAI
jgi:hypothetical protein